MANRRHNALTAMSRPSHSGGSASRLALLEITWGRVVDVHALDASGEPTSEPVLRDLVIDENLRTEPETWRLETSPITQETRLVIERVPGVLTPEREDFEALVRRATQHLAAVVPKSDGDSTSHPFSFLARNATLMLRFDDLLDDGEESVQDLAPKSEPKGKWSTRPMQVEDDLESIVRAMGGDAGMLKGVNVKGHKSGVPVGEF